jgi:hypothetical protein
MNWKKLVGKKAIIAGVQWVVKEIREGRSLHYAVGVDNPNTDHFNKFRRQFKGEWKDVVVTNSSLDKAAEILHPHFETAE